jgi:hypothetical protein
VRPQTASVLQSVFWLVLVVGAVTAPVGRPFRTVSTGFGDVVRRHGLDPAAAQRVRRVVYLGQAAQRGAERGAAADWAETQLDLRARAPREQRARWWCYLVLQGGVVASALTGLVLALVLRGGHAVVLEVLFALMATGPLVGPLVRRRRDVRVRRAAALNGEDQPAGEGA